MEEICIEKLMSLECLYYLLYSNNTFEDLFSFPLFSLILFHKTLKHTKIYVHKNVGSFLMNSDIGVWDILTKNWKCYYSLFMLIVSFTKFTPFTTFYLIIALYFALFSYISVEQNKKGVIFDRVFFIIAVIISTFHIILYALLSVLQTLFVKYPVLMVITYGHYVEKSSREHIGSIILYSFVLLFSFVGMLAVFILTDEQKQKFAEEEETDYDLMENTVPSLTTPPNDTSVIGKEGYKGGSCRMYFLYLLTPTICILQMVMLNIVGLIYLLLMLSLLSCSLTDIITPSSSYILCCSFAFFHFLSNNKQRKCMEIQNGTFFCYFGGY
jgi:hypothetical protein